MTNLQIGIEWFDKGNKPFPFWNLSIQKKNNERRLSTCFLLS